MPAFYNEFDPKAAAWLRELIKADLIAPGHVDERSIKEVTPKDLDGYEQCHFFAGIGGWSFALRLAGVADDAAIWTGSCPCQPYSSAGKQLGDDDARNLWPDFYRLIAKCRPDVVFGEQVESAIRFGWLDGVCADLEREGYAVGHAVLGAHSVNAPHIRQRLWWVGHSDRKREDSIGGICEGSDTVNAGRVGGMADAEHAERGTEHEKHGSASGRHRPGWGGGSSVACRDGKTRRIEPGIAPLVDGLPGRVGLLRGYGNAIVPQVAAAFVEAYLGTIDDLQRKEG